MDGMLSQEEINALLAGVDNGGVQKVQQNMVMNVTTIP